MGSDAPRGRVKRRAFLGGAAAVGAGAALDRVVGGREQAASAQGAAPHAARPIAFEGAHQAGIATPSPKHAIFAAFDSIAPSRAELSAALEALSDRARRLTRGYDALLGAPGEGPTPDSGIVGPQVAPDGLTVTIAFGATLFDDRYGLASRKPRHLKPMTTFPDDALVAEECHGDVLLQLCANGEQTLLNALRDLMRATRGALAGRWKVEGFLPQPRESGAPRNLLGFKDGTANPDVGDAAEMDRLVWVGRDGGEPAWAVGGTYQVVRIIRNRVEFWDRVARSEQELMIGRDKGTGAPLGKRREGDDPEYRTDPNGDRIPMDSHIRLARPRTAATEGSRILRRGFNYSRGLDMSGQLDMGLVFCCFQADVERQFEAVQRRLAGEPLVDYVVPTGGGYFFVAPGARDSQDWVGSGLLA
ncbi:MAG: deferrochelatase/peroxidase EfeB [Solirubrobacteraceae bacterium]